MHFLPLSFFNGLPLFSHYLIQYLDSRLEKPEKRVPGIAFPENLKLQERTLPHVENF